MRSQHPPTFKSRLKRAIRRNLLSPITAPYLPTEYERLWKECPDGAIHTWLTPYRRWRDRAIFTRHLRPSDVFVVGHPKSGNTWIAYMLAVILAQDHDERVTMANVGDHVPVIHGRDSNIRKYGELPNPRFFRNEWPVYPELYPKTIYLTRDPRAALVSYYHMYRAIFSNDDITMAAFIEEYMRNGEIRRWEPLVRWDRQVLHWIERSGSDASVMILRYEDMVKDRREALRRVADFADIACSEVDIARAVERGAFEAMRASESKHGAESYQVAGKGGQFVRKGKVDGWKEELSPECAALIQHEFKTAMEAVGYA